MKVDRVIGLRPPSYMRRDELYCPVAGSRLLLPFVAVEAKREGQAPGFRAIACQTAFAIRRFLLAQKLGGSNDVKPEPLLVWYLDYQGEEWRVHICIMEKERFVSYSLLLLLSVLICHVRMCSTSGWVLYSPKTVPYNSS